MVYHRIPFSALLFLIYSADIDKIAQHHNTSLFSFADDNQVYTHGGPSQKNVLWNKPARCIEEISLWIKSNRLKQALTG